MTPLPQPPAEPLHVLPPWLGWIVLAAAIGSVLWAAASYIWRRRRRPRQLAARRPSPTQEVAERTDLLADRIDAIRRHYDEQRAWRDGCHALSAELRHHLEQRTGQEVEEMTVAELAERFVDPRLADLFARLRESQFGRRPPGRADLVGLCKRAQRVVARNDKLELRKES